VQSGAPTKEEKVMPFVNVKLVGGVFTEDEKHRMAAALTDVGPN
jgi:hypothetical protein